MQEQGSTKVREAKLTMALNGSLTLSRLDSTYAHPA